MAFSEMLQTLVWSVVVSVFSACILLDQALFGEYHNVITNNFNGSSYDFIIGEIYLTMEIFV